MEHKTKKVIPEHEKEIVSHTTCDICKRSNKHGKDRCDISETEINYRVVDYLFPECGGGTNYRYDICHECFVDKVMPALSDLGAVPTIEEWDY